MIKKDLNTKILVIHGPNMNIIGFKFREDKSRITLDKINRCLQKEANKLKQDLKIIQTNEEGKAVTILQRQRKKISGILLFPGPWQKSGHVLNDTLEILSIPYVTISLGEKTEVLRGINNIRETDLLKACKTALVSLSGLI